MPAPTPDLLVSQFIFLRTVASADISLLCAEKRDCPICLSPYTTQSWQPNSPIPLTRPIILPCNHTICISCLARWIFTSDQFPNNCLTCWKPIISTSTRHGEISTWDLSSRVAWMTFAQIKYAVRSSGGRWGEWPEKLYQGLGGFAYGELGSDEAKEMKERMSMLFEIYFEPLRHPNSTLPLGAGELAMGDAIVPMGLIQGLDFPLVHANEGESRIQVWARLGGEIGLLAIMTVFTNILLWKSEWLLGGVYVSPQLVLRLDAGLVGFVVGILFPGKPLWKVVLGVCFGVIWLSNAMVWGLGSGVGFQDAGALGIGSSVL